MTLNRYERAVIETARNLYGLDAPLPVPLIMAVQNLIDHERAQAAAGVREIEWVLVTVGDEIRGQSGTFYPVLKTKRQYDMGTYTGKVIVTVKLPNGPKDIVRPHANEPFATVRRGPDGATVDEFVNVFSSGEA